MEHCASPCAATRRISEQLAERVGHHKYDMWFGHTKLRVDGKHIEVATDSLSVAKWIDAHFAEDLKGVAMETLGEDARIDVRVAPEMFPHRRGGRSARNARFAGTRPPVRGPIRQTPPRSKAASRARAATVDPRSTGRRSSNGSPAA